MAKKLADFFAQRELAEPAVNVDYSRIDWSACAAPG